MRSSSDPELKGWGGAITVSADYTETTPQGVWRVKLIGMGQANEVIAEIPNLTNRTDAEALGEALLIAYRCGALYAVNS